MSERNRACQVRLPLPTAGSGLSQPLRSELVVAKSAYPCPPYCLPRARGDRSARPKGKQSEDWRRRPAREDALPRASRLLLEGQISGIGERKDSAFRRRQGPAGFKLKIPARPQLSRQGPRPRAGRASPGPRDFPRPRSLGDAARLGGAEAPTRPAPRPAPLTGRSVQERGAAGRSDEPPSSSLRPWRLRSGAGPGRGPDTRPRPRPAPRGPAAGAAPGPRHPARRERDAPGPARAAEAPGAQPQPGRRPIADPPGAGSAVLGAPHPRAQGCPLRPWSRPEPRPHFCLRPVSSLGWPGAACPPGEVASEEGVPLRVQT